MGHGKRAKWCVTSLAFPAPPLLNAVHDTVRDLTPSGWIMVLAVEEERLHCLIAVILVGWEMLTVTMATCDQIQNTYCSICPTRPRTTTGDRAFFAAAPTLWNALPDELRALGSLKTFMARLKTHYFKLAFSL